MCKNNLNVFFLIYAPFSILMTVFKQTMGLYGDKSCFGQIFNAWFLPIKSLNDQLIGLIG